MIVHLNRDWRIRSDDVQWIVDRRMVRKKGKNIGEADWEVQAYCMSLDSAVAWCAKQRVALIGGTYGPEALPELCAALDAIKADVKRVAA